MQVLPLQMWSVLPTMNNLSSASGVFIYYALLVVPDHQ
jgi:hypothetical protein